MRCGHRKIRAAAAERVRERHDADEYAAVFHDLINTFVGETHAVGPPNP